MSGHVREALGGDAPAIAAIVAPFALETTITFTSVPHSALDISSAMGKNIWRVYEEIDGTVVGYASLSAFRSGPGYDRVREVSIGLAPGARGKGHGRALMHTLERDGRARGLTALVACISGENPGAVAFHEACGYSRVGLLPGIGWKFGRRLDLIVMQKDLSPHAPAG